MPLVNANVDLQSTLPYPQPEYPATSPSERIFAGTYFFHYNYNHISEDSRVRIRTVTWGYQTTNSFAKMSRKSGTVEVIASLVFVVSLISL